MTLAVLLVLPAVGCESSSPVTEDLYFSAIHAADGYFGRLYIDNTNTYLDSDAMGNMVFTDVATGTQTLATLLGGGDLDDYSVALDDFSDWHQVIVNSGTTIDEPTRATVFTSAIPLSSALRYTEIAPIQYGAAPASINWDKKLIWVFSVVKINDDSDFVGRIQIKEPPMVAGQLVTSGIGLQMFNFALIGETYGGGGRDIVNLTTTLSSSFCYGVMVVHTPGKQDEFFINSGTGWVSKGLIADPTRIPSGMAGNWDYMVVSGENGVSGGVNNELSLYKPYVWSEQ